MGGHKYIYEVITRLKSMYGVEVILITSGLNAEATKHFSKSKIPVIKLFSFSTNSIIYWMLLPFFLFIEKWYLIIFKKIDRNAFFISSMFPANVLANSISFRTAQLCYEPFAFFYDENFIKGFNRFEKIFISIISFFYKTLDKKSVQRNRITFTISQSNKQWIKDSYGINSKVVYEGVDLNFFKKTTNLIISQKYKNKHIIFHSTDYTQIKGTSFLIKALPKVLKIIPNLKLIISETLPESLAKMDILNLVKKLGLTKNINFVGFLPYEQLPAYLSLADVVVQPSIRQSMNLTVKEAMACETPIITSLEGYEQTNDGEAGFLVNPHDTGSLSETIIKCILDEKESFSFGRKGRKIIENKFSWESVTDKIWKDLKKQYV